jgi:2-succinyl-5-enolpyruvyl-6-hydroxy-3-cyclohexene-1-carboxylate synthase
MEAAAAEPVWPPAVGSQPLHINVCFDEPLVGESTGIDFADQSPKAAQLELVRPDDVERASRFIANREGLVVLASGLHPDEAARLAPALERLGAPIVTEATANLPASDLIVRGGEKALAALASRRVLRIGGVPSWRWWRDLEDRAGSIEVLHLSNAPFSGLSWQSAEEVLPLIALTCDGIDVVSETHGNSAALALDSALKTHPLSEPAWMRHLANGIPADSRLFLGNSLPIREWNLAGHAASGVAVFANRGANGIDGLVSTFFGTSAGAGEAWLVVGDLSALYDLAAPWIIDQLPSARRRIVIINNGGGKIFSRVASLRALDPASRGVIENRHAISFEPWAQLWQMPYRRVVEPGQLSDLPDGDVMIEVIPDAAQTEAFWAAWQS